MTTNAEYRAMYQPIAEKAARANLVPVKMFDDQITTESDWNPDAVSASNAIGILQIIQRWHPNVDPYDPIASINYGAALDAANYKKRGSWKLALLDYNWGPANVDKWIAAGSDDTKISGEGQRYLTKILGPGWPEPTTVVTPVTPSFSVGQGILNAMSSNNDSPATDELYFKNDSGVNMVSSAWGKSGARYDYIFSTNETHRFPQG